MRAPLVVLAAAVAASLGAVSPLGRPVPRPSVPDTVWAPPADSLTLSGFEKPLRAKTETMFLTNNMAETVDYIDIEITYQDIDGRMLHKASYGIEMTVPPGETRIFEIPSFDRNQIYYYFLSPVPPRAEATPFRVAVDLRYAVKY